ncbi:hypothetical protein [Siccirubricoccus phaeus]|uniref:hypothetical protein n=1 Tax=Siccirubricoccus phaeus TaxID=2595053 RepID=UPI0011F0F7D7|nr:hypothetical protein [Siccirubricoccus phaeus]
MKGPVRSEGVSLFVGLALMAAMLAGCGMLDELDRQEYERACNNLGITRGTPSWDQCMLQQQALDKEGTERFLDRTAEREAVERLRRR